MYPIIFPLWGPFNINSYGCMIALGVIVVTTLLKRDPQTRLLMSFEQLSNVIIMSIISGVIGGRLLTALCNPEQFNSYIEIFQLYKGGFSILGCVLGIFFVTGTYLYLNNISALKTLDLIALYAPLLQAIARLGCFLAGCCYGSHSTMPWAITYTHPACFAPLRIALHPTQLYSSFLLLSIFGIMWVLHKRQFPQGMLLSIYLLLIGLQRFGVDYFRGDRITIMYGLSYDQYIAVAIMLISFGYIVAIRLKIHERYKHI